MNWYSRTTTADASWNWNSFNRTLLQTVGVSGAVMALMIYFNMDKRRAEQMVQQQPQQVEQHLQQIPKQELIHLTNKSPLATPVEQPSQQSHQQPQSVAGGLSEEEIKQQIIGHEGREHMAYRDSTGHMTVGIGFNLERKDAKSLLSSIGADYASVYNKRSALNDRQIDQLFSITFNEAKTISQQVIPDLASHPAGVQKAIVDMTFNLGPNIANFKKFISSINQRDYKSAAQEMINSRWYGQVGSRGRNLVRMVSEAANPQPSQP